MKKYKIARIFCMICAVMLLFPSSLVHGVSFTPFTYNDDGKAEPIKLYSKAAYMYNVDTGEVLIDVNSDEERVPASLTKIMTGIILLDKFDGDKEKMKNTYYSAGSKAFDELYGTEASTADIQPDEKVSAYDLFAALMIASACESANIIALNLSDSLKNFTILMNDKAEELGLEHTHFSNAHGLSASNNYSSCKDMAKLCEYAIKKYPLFKEVVSMPSYTMTATDKHPEGTVIYNTNYALNEASNYYYAPIKGIKTGTHESAGRCLASYAVSGGQTYITVTMGAPMNKTDEDTAKGLKDSGSIFADDVVYYNILDHIRLYKWAFTSVISTDFIDPNSELRDVKVQYGSNADYANLKPAHGYTQLWPVNIPVDDVEKKITVYDNIVAPIEKGDVLGKLELVYEGEVLATIDLVSATKVERSTARAEMKVASSFFHSVEFKVTIGLIAGVFIVYLAVFIFRMQKQYLKKH